MATELPSQLVEYHAFVKSALSKGGSIDNDATPAAFLEYLRQLSHLRESLRPGMERYERGEEAEEVDIDQFVEDVLRHPSRRSEPS